MRVSVRQDPLFVEIICDADDDIVGVEVQHRPHGKQILYVCINGATILRINRIKHLEVKGMGRLK